MNQVPVELVAQMDETNTTRLMILMGISAISVIFYLFADSKKIAKGRVLGKMTAASCFIILALLMGASQSTFGQIMMAAFFFCWLGDLFLLSREQKWFLSGLVSFLIGHLAFTFAFYQRGIETKAILFPTLCVIFSGLLIGYWLLPKVSKEMKVPVLVYMIAIITMVVCAFGTHHHTSNGTIPLAALVFMVSDIYVARDQFVHQSFTNRLIGAPLYFGAQMAFATTVSVA